MANEQNLIPFNKMTKKQQREIARKGGIASSEARKKRATMKETLEIILDEKNEKGITYRELATLGLIRGAIKGNGNNYRTILEVLGELAQLEQDKQQKELSKVEELLLKIEKEANNDNK